MLIITRRPGERIMLGDDTTIHIMEIVGNTVRVGVKHRSRSRSTARRSGPPSRKRTRLPLRPRPTTLPRPAARA